MSLGPGIVSASSSNDPTTVATLSIVGATTGYSLCWLVVIVIPMLAIVQSIAASVGGASGTSVQGAVRKRYGLGWALVTLLAIVSVNVFTLTADVKAGSEAAALITRLPANAFIIPFAAVVALMLVSQSYGRVERYLTILPIVFVCYAAAGILAHFDGRTLLRSVFVPHFEMSQIYVLAAIALLGTTLTGYVYVWESIEVAERRPRREAIASFERDAAFGMLAIGVVFLFIVVATAATLGKHHVAIETASDAAAALAPLAGRWAGLLFGIGLLASAALAVPVLAATTAYVVAHTFDWPGSLDRRVREAKGFYVTLLLSLAVASLLAFLPVSPVGILYWASIAGGVATPITLFFLIRMARDSSVMGESRIGRRLAAGGWIVTSCVTAAALLFFAVQLPRGQNTKTARCYPTKSPCAAPIGDERS